VRPDCTPNPTHHRDQVDGDEVTSLELVFTSKGIVTHCRLLGELDAGTADALLADVARTLEPTVALLELHLDDLRFCDAAGVNAFLRVRSHVARNRTDVMLCGAHGIVRRVFDIVELQRAIAVVR
jgi:anti-anti-sigma factor